MPSESVPKPEDPAPEAAACVPGGATGGTPRGLLRDIGAAGVLALIILVAHGASRWDGLFFDDHWHRATLRAADWSWHDLIEAATFDLPGQLNNLWWQERLLQWRYARPVAMAAMKAELLLTGGDPRAIHACALGWHLATTLCVYGLALWALGHRGWALLAGAIFAFNPHSIFAVSWIAARNALVGGCFFAAALLAYVQASLPQRAPRLRGGRELLILSVLLWLAALFCRESAVVFPVVVVLVDLAFGGWRHVWRRMGLYVVLAILTLGYLYWRLIVFPTRGVPDIYFTTPHGWEYVVWAAGRLLHLLFAQITYTPMFLGLGTYGGGVSRASYVFMGLITGAVLLWYMLATRRVRGRWLWPVVTVLGFVPVVPVFVMPHFSYLPAITYAVMVTLLLRQVAQRPAGTPVKRRRWRWRPKLVVLIVAAMVWSHIVYRVLWRAVLRSEQLIHAAALLDPPPPPGAQLVFINLPVVGIYTPVALREAWNTDVTGYVLTFAPETLEPLTPPRVMRTGEQTIRVETAAPGFFSGLAGRMLVDGMRTHGRLAPGTTVAGPLFDATVVAATDAGVTGLEFTFHLPLTDPAVRFYLSTPQHPAAVIDWQQVPVGATVALDPAVADTYAERFAAWRSELAWYTWIRSFAQRVVRSDVLLTQ